jgi:SOUL heme-binding protein
MLKLVTAVFAAILQTFGVRAGTEQPRYAVVERVGDVEVRRYDARLAAEVTVGGDEIAARTAGFQLLARYIFGGNASRTGVAMTAPVAQQNAGRATRESVAMTAPVAQQPAEGGWRVQFFLPSSYTLATAPRPLDNRVRLVELPPQTYAVTVWSGDRSASAVAHNQQRLLQALAGSHWTARGQPVAWLYDPPWTVPFLRRNEAAVEVAQVTPAATGSQR